MISFHGKGIYAKSILALVALIITMHFAWISLDSRSSGLFQEASDHTKGLLLQHFQKGTAEQPTEDVFQNVLNSTFGFEKVIFINVASRFDRSDTMAMQSELINLKYETRDAFLSSDVDEKHIGLALTSGDNLSNGQVACMRSHANAWKEMLDNDWETMLVLEGDATWDVNLKDIGHRMAEGMQGLYDKHHSLRRVNNTGATVEDPWDYQQWDYLAFGACMESAHRADMYYKYQDVDSPSANYHYESEEWGVNVTEKLENERLVRATGSPVCTGAYAVTREGAKKFLLRAMVDMDCAVDLMIAELMREGRAVGVTPFPSLIYQWEYISGIGAENRNSDIDKERTGTKSENWAEIWKNARKNWNVWRINGMWGSVPFKHHALKELHNYIMPF